MTTTDPGNARPSAAPRQDHPSAPARSGELHDGQRAVVDLEQVHALLDMSADQRLELLSRQANALLELRRGLHG